MEKIMQIFQNKRIEKTEKYKKELMDRHIRTMEKMGTIEKKDNEIICHVSQEYIDKAEKKAIFENSLSCYGIKIDKRFIYDFDNITFNKRLGIYAPCSDIIVRNSKFNSLVKIRAGNNLKLENNKYNFEVVEFAVDYKCAFDCEAHDTITIINENLRNMNLDDRFSPSLPQLDVNFEAKNIILDNSLITSDKGIVQIQAEQLKTDRSSVRAEEVYMDADDITTSDSLIIGYTKGIIINNKNENNIKTLIQNLKGNAISNVFYNNVCISKKNTNVFLFDSEFARKRLSVLETLKKVNDICQSDNEIVLKRIKNQLNSRKVNSVVKRK